jgi:hypothetical protein
MNLEFVSINNVQSNKAIVAVILMKLEFNMLLSQEVVF